MTEKQALEKLTEAVERLVDSVEKEMVPAMEAIAEAVVENTRNQNGQAYLESLKRR